MIQNTAKWRRPASMGALALFILFIVSCGSSSNDTTTAPVNTDQDRYLGSNSFNNGQSGALDFSVFGNGSATGTFTVTNDIAAQTTLTPGSYSVVGSGSLVNNIFSLSGFLPVLGNFTIQGILPTGSGQTAYVLNVNNQNYQGVLQTAAQGPPNSGGGNPDEGQIISGGTVNALTFQFGNGYNGENPPVDASSIISGAFGTGEKGEKSLTISLSEVIVGSTTSTNVLTVSIVDPNGNDLVLNQAYDVVVNTTDAGSLVTLSEAIDTSVDKNWVSEGQTSIGTATVTALTDSQVTVEFSFNNLIPNSEISGNQATGAFDVNGSITGNFVTTP